MPGLFCSLCDYSCHDQRYLLKHLRDVHENEANFQVNCCVCSKSFKKWSTFKKHLHRTHKDTDSTEPSVGSTDQGDSFDADNQNPNDDIVEAGGDQQWESARFLLKVTEEHSLTHNGVDSFCECVQNFVDDVCSEISGKVKEQLPQDLPAHVKEGIIASCQVGDLFEGLMTRHRREKYYERNFNYVEPTPVVMGSDWTWKVQNGQRKLVEEKHFGYYIDLFSSLKMLLSNPAVRREIDCSHACTDGVMKDYCDAQFFKTHPIFSAHPNALQFVLYYDEIEVANPLGAKAGNHKLGVFYYLLGNIRPVFRSSLQSIQLLAVAKNSDIRQFGYDSLLSSFVTQVNKLGKEEGYTLQLLRDEEIRLHGAVLAFCGDTPASCLIGGFKEGVGFSLRKCRRCMVTNDDMTSKFHASECIGRTKASHAEQLELIAAGESRDSATYGINRPSPLKDLIGFDITRCLPFDIMHTIFEGVVTTHLNFLFHHIMDECRYLCLRDLNHIITSHDYGYSEVDTKPSLILRESATADFHFKQSASQMMTLVRLLPFMIGTFVDEDDDHWECFLTLWDICSTACSFEVTIEDAVELTRTIETYLETMHTLYPAFTPKMHYLVHLPEQMILFGPLRQHWCMRFESKNAQIKRYVSCCFKNVPLTVAIRHQQWMSHQLATRPDQLESNLFYAGDETISGTLVEDCQYGSEIMALCGGSTASPTAILSCRGVKIHGITYKIGSVVRMRSQDEEVFDYGQICEVYVCQDSKVFMGKRLEITAYEPHRRAIEVTISDRVFLMLSTQLHCHGVLHLKQCRQKYYVVEKDNWVKPSLFY